MHRHIRERNKYPLMLAKHLFLAVQVLYLTEHKFYELHTDVQ